MNRALGFIALLPALLAYAAFEDAPAPKPVVDWLSEAKKHAPAVNELVAARSDGPAARIVIVGRAFSGVVELAQLEGSVAANAKAGDVIALDIGPRQGEQIDHWLRTGTGQIDEILASAAAFDWSRAEARTWLGALSRREAKPRIVGISTGDSKLAYAEFIAYLGKVDTNAVPRAEHALRPLSLDGQNGEPRYAQLDDTQRAVLRMGLDETLSLVRDAEEAYTKKSSAAEYARNLRLLVEMQQYEEVLRFEHDAGEHDPRGRILAENAQRALEAAAQDARMFAFVGLRDVARASDPDSFAAVLVKLGAPRALCLGTASGAATFRAIDPSAVGSRVPREMKVTSDGAGALERALSAASGDARWILDLRTKPGDEAVTKWLAAHRSLRSAKPVCGAALETPWDHDVLGDFDALAWFPTLTASTLVR
jgi:hypothetical protein